MIRVCILLEITILAAMTFAAAPDRSAEIVAEAGETLSRNNVATAGCGREGATALCLSNAKLDQANSPDGFILGVILPGRRVVL